MAEMGSFAYQHARLDELVTGERRAEAVETLRTYFDPDGVTGRLFDSYGGRGDDPDVRGQVTDTDFVAVSMLGMGSQIPKTADAFAVNSELRESASELLRQIPVDVPLSEASDELIADGSPADKLWHLIAGAGGKNRRVMAYKLTGRKRPDLLPVADSNVFTYLGQPERFWDCMWSWFQDSDRVEAVEEMRAEVGTIGHVSLLRTLDVPMWASQNSAPR